MHDSIQLVSRKQALALGLKRYVTGKPCKHGHYAERFTSNCFCCICGYEAVDKYQSGGAGKEAIKAYRQSASARGLQKHRKARYRAKEETRQKERAYNQVWADQNRESLREKARARYRVPQVREKALAYQSSPENRTRARVHALKRSKTERYKAVRRRYKKERFARDPNFRLACYLRSRLLKALKGRPRNGSAVRLLGCTVSECLNHIELQFLDGMSWSNHGAWHVDHIQPLSSFDLTDPGQLAAACHYTNLQPLWARINIQKGAKTSHEEGADLC